jgi:lysyl-tRNA synthetase class 1
MYSQPKRAKRLYFDSIPKTVDEYFAHAGKLAEMDEAQQLENPAWHIRISDDPSASDMPVSFSLLLNLAAVCSAETTDVIWGYLSEYAPGASPQTHPHLDKLAGYAVTFYQDKVRPHKRYRMATADEKQHITALKTALEALDDAADGDEIQSAVYRTGKDAEYENLRDWFGCLYETMLGQSQGPRMGGFFKLYGRVNALQLCDDVLQDKLVSATDGQ